VPAALRARGQTLDRREPHKYVESMTQTVWTEVDQYFTDTLMPPDPALDAALAASDAAGLPAINVAPNQGKLLYLLARLRGARRILEIGTLGGYSTIWLARALPPDGSLITLEYHPRHAEVARGNLARAGLADRVEVRVGPALSTLTELTGPFDLTFIDADKENNAAYFRRALELSTVGSLIVVDNVVRGGRVADPRSDDSTVVGTRKLMAAIATEPRVTATAIQTVGSKSYDGFALALVTGQA
jgi:predicted O-methyltransferase YrrM